MTEGTEPARSRRDLCVVLEVEPGPENSCPLGALDGQIVDVRQQLAGGECHTDTILQTDDSACSSERECTEVVHSTSPVETTCPCTVFGEFGCVPDIVGTADGRLLIETYLSDRERLSELIESLKAVSGGLRLRQLKRIDTGTVERTRETVTLDLYEITEKQREAVAKAVAEGYYSTPRETSVDELAAAFGISTSALSQRLKAVESKLATAAFAQASADG